MIQNVPTSSMRLDICLRSRCELRDVAGYADKYENSEFPVEKLEKSSQQIMKLLKKGQLFLAEGFIWRSNVGCDLQGTMTQK